MVIVVVTTSAKIMATWYRPWNIVVTIKVVEFVQRGIPVVDTRTKQLHNNVVLLQHRDVYRMIWDRTMRHVVITRRMIATTTTTAVVVVLQRLVVR
jgi:hypothetical protein